jgi:hypothetical protein
MSLFQEKPTKKKKVKTTQVVDGHEREVEIEVDDVGDMAWASRGSLALLNHDLPRVDGPAKVTGRARYTHDVACRTCCSRACSCARCRARA